MLREGRKKILVTHSAGRGLFIFYNLLFLIPSAERIAQRIDIYVGFQMAPR